MQSSPHRPERTLVASVLFVDIVEFSRASVTEQIEIKRALTKVLRRTLSSIDDDDYRLMDTGDGAAIGFLSDPEHALYFALAIDAAVRDTPSSSGLGPGALRIGINVGPVKDVLDVNERPTLIGDGINTAQRIVSFAEPGQITISRSFFELVSRLAPEYSGIFVHVGMHDDKHGREHDVYVVKPAKDILGKIQERLQIHVAEATGLNVVFSGGLTPTLAPTGDAPHAAPPPSAVPVQPESTPSDSAVPMKVADGAGTRGIARAQSFGAAATDAPTETIAAPSRRSWLLASAALLVVAAIILTPLLTSKVRVASSPSGKPIDTTATQGSVSDGTKAGTAGAALAPAPAVSTPAVATSPRSPADSAHIESSTRMPGTASADRENSDKKLPSAREPGAMQGTAPDSTQKIASKPAASTSATASTATSARSKAANEGLSPSKTANPPGAGTYSRCSNLMQKASVGVVLTPAERQEMAQFCR